MWSCFHVLIYILAFKLGTTAYRYPSHEPWTPSELAKRSSDGDQMELFEEWLERLGIECTTQEERRARFKIFKKHLAEIVQTNAENKGYTETVNFMTALTDEERHQHYGGINISSNPVGEWNPDPALAEKQLMSSAESVDWRSEGKVTEVRHQGGCNSCWAFAGICAFEGRYAIASGGAVRRFSEQEFLDCTYEGEDGRVACSTGWYWNAFDNTVGETQHLALSTDYPYTGEELTCRSSSTANGMTGPVSFQGTGRVPYGDDGALATAVADGPVAIAFEIHNDYWSYNDGILTLSNCGMDVDHAMGLVGYTSDYWDLKNSWGSSWGDNGFVKFSRSITNMCGISSFAAYPLLTNEEACMLADQDIPNGALEEISVSSYDECKAACLSNTECAAFTFHSTESVCVLKDSNTDDPVSFADRMSGYKTCYYEADCEDLLDGCNGYYCCERGYEDRMAAECPVTCGTCSTRTQNCYNEGDGDCFDSNASCEEWATVNNYCCEGDYQEWMAMTCQQSCGTCNGAEPNCCFDLNSSCPSWSVYCVGVYQSYMEQNCAATCGLC